MNLTAPHTPTEIQKMLRDCFEGCIPWNEAKWMCGATAEMHPDLRKQWNVWNRKFEASQKAW